MEIGLSIMQCPSFYEKALNFKRTHNYRHRKGGGGGGGGRGHTFWNCPLYTCTRFPMPLQRQIQKWSEGRAEEEFWWPHHPLFKHYS